jgi:hypothetical protein
MSMQTVDRKLLLRLFKENELTLREIGERLGCSGERVRQLQKKLLGRTAQEARGERSNRKLQSVFDKNPFVHGAKRHGFDVEPLKRERRRRPPKWHKRKLYVNGKLCLLLRSTGNVGYRGLYVRLRKPETEKARICVIEVLTGDFLMIPMEKMPSSPTMFSLYNPVSSKKIYVLRHPWRKYLNNWSVFGKKQTLSHSLTSVLRRFISASALDSPDLRASVVSYR